MYDVIIIGAGVSGCACARELSRYQVSACVIEKEEDVCAGTSKANSGIVHAGYDAPSGSLKAKLNVQGNEMMGKLAEELDFPFQRNGSMVICLNEEELPNLQELYEKGLCNGVKELRIINKQELHQMEPNISDHAVAALYAPTAGIVCPFGLTIALAENAFLNGIEFKFNTEVQEIYKIDKGWEVKTKKGIQRAKYIINAAGVYADVFHNMVSQNKIHITPRRGDYCLMDKTEGEFVKSTIFQLPSKAGKGVLVTPSIHGNLIVGPNAIDIQDKEGTNTTQDGIEEILSKAANTVKNLKVKKVITSFAGLRAHEDNGEFIIKELEDAQGFIDCAGIESPGLSASPAIGLMIANILKNKLNLEPNLKFIGTRKGIVDFKKLSKEDKNQLVKAHPAYGNVICRCEMVTEGEILDAIHRPLGAKSLDGIKRRVRVGSGRCQAGFCLPKTIEILAREFNVSRKEITKCGGDSYIILDQNKDQL